MSIHYLNYLGSKYINDKFFNHIDCDYDNYKEEFLQFIDKEPKYDEIKINSIIEFDDDINIVDEFDLDRIFTINKNKFDLNQMSYIEKNEFFKKFFGLLVFQNLYSSIVKSESSSTVQIYPHIFPLEKSGSEYVKYINELPKKEHTINYILVKCLMLKDFLKIYNNYKSDSSLMLINIDDVEKNLKNYEELLFV